MADYQVNPEDMGLILQELTSANERLKTKINELKQIRTDLAGMWEGAAEEAYASVLAEEIQTLEGYHSLMGDYHAVLAEIGMEYTSIEMENLHLLEE